jgi:hypothetical protein
MAYLDKNLGWEMVPEDLHLETAIIAIDAATPIGSKTITDASKALLAKALPLASEASQNKALTKLACYDGLSLSAIMEFYPKPYSKLWTQVATTTTAPFLMKLGAFGLTASDGNGRYVAEDIICSLVEQDKMALVILFFRILRVHAERTWSGIFTYTKVPTHVSARLAEIDLREKGVLPFNSNIVEATDKFFRTAEGAAIKEQIQKEACSPVSSAKAEEKPVPIKPRCTDTKVNIKTLTADQVSKLDWSDSGNWGQLFKFDIPNANADLMEVSEFVALCSASITFAKDACSTVTLAHFSRKGNH